MESINRSYKVNIKETFSLFSVFGFIYLLLLIVFFIGIYKYLENDIESQLEIKESNLNHQASEIIEEYITQIKSDVYFLVRQTELFYEYERSDFERHLNETFYQFSISKGIYNQIRFLDSSGMEKIRIDYTNSGIKVVDKERLQDKSSRYYFKEIMEFPMDSVYFSPMDLNVENGSVEVPFKPMIRIGSSVFNPQRERIGILVVNFFGDKIIEKLKKQDINSVGHTLFLNRQGYYFIGLDNEDEWGFMFSDKNEKTFFNDFSEESKIIFNENTGSFSSQKGMFSFSTVNSIQKNTSPGEIENSQSRSWKIISYVPIEEVDALFMAQVKMWLIAILFISIIVFVLLWFLSQNIILKRTTRLMLVQKNEELGQANAAKDKFFSIIAHDLKSPCASMLSLSELLAVGGIKLQPDDLDSALKAFYSTAKNTSSLLDNLLQWARLQTNRMKPVPVEVDLDDIFNEVTGLLGENAQQKGIGFIDKTQKGIKVFADKEMINTVIRNIISNAVKFTPQDGWIRLFAEKTNDNKVVIKIQDTGVGMSKEQLAKLFKVGNVNSTLGTANEKGTGLGLILCKEFVEQNNGELLVESEKDKGTTFTIVLPILQPIQ